MRNSALLESVLHYLTIVPLIESLRRSEPGVHQEICNCVTSNFACYSNLDLLMAYSVSIL